MGEAVTRRSFVATGGAFGLLALAPAPLVRELLASASAAAGDGHFLNAHEMATLRALCARLIPGPPDDPDPGAVEAKVPEAIDLLLGAFTLMIPPIHAGGPFSNRHGSRHDYFADFVKLDRHAELGWRIRIEGSQGKPEREFAGPVTGLQQIYRDGLKHVDDKAGGDFAALPSPAQIVLLEDQSDSDLQDFLGVAFEHALEFMYGPPEYGGNQRLAGWLYTNWPGDRQPLGFTPEQVSNADGEPPANKPDAALLKAFAPHLAGGRASRDKWWLRRKGLLTK
jgi:gluconate 2-dehydrogenase subunit 3-like protein